MKFNKYFIILFLIFMCLSIYFLKHLIWTKNKIYNLENLSKKEHKKLTETLSTTFKHLDSIHCSHLIDILIITVQLEITDLNKCKPLVSDIIDERVQNYNKNTKKIQGLGESTNIDINNNNDYNDFVLYYFKRVHKLFNNWKRISISQLLEISLNFYKYIKFNPNVEKNNYNIVLNNNEVFKNIKIKFDKKKFDKKLYQSIIGEDNTHFFDFTFTLFIRYVFGII